MSPRKYDMTRRRAATEATRARIVDATFEVHGEQGIAGARLDDIAKRAGVSIGTLYRHFPTYEALVTACGRLTFERFPPPRADEADEALAGLPPGRERSRRLVDRLFSFYEQTGPMIEALRHDSASLPFLAKWSADIDAGIDDWVETALADAPAMQRRVARALIDHRTWTALTEQRIEDTHGLVVDLLDRAADEE